MRSTRTTHAVVRDGRRLRLREPDQPTLSEDWTLLIAARLRSRHALRFGRRRRSLTGLARAAGRQVLSFLGLL